MEADDDARERLIQQATRQEFVTQLKSVRRHLVLGSVQVVAGLGLFVGCVYVALRVGEVSFALGGLGFLLVVFGGTQIVRGLGGGLAARRKLRAHDALALPAARVVKQ